MLIDGSSWVTCNSRDGILWISSFGNDLYTIDPYYTKFQHVDLKQSVLAFYEDKDHALWIGTSTGLVRRDNRTGKIDSFIIDTIKHNSLINNIVLSIAKDADDNLWIGTRGNGLHMYNPKTKIFTSYHHDPKDNNSLFNDSVDVVYADTDHNLFIGTESELDVMNLKTRKFTHYFFDKKRLSGINFIGTTCILQDNTGRFWIGTGNGVIQLDLKTGKFKRFLEGIQTDAILQDSANTIWIGSYQRGLSTFDPVSNSNQHIINPSTVEAFPSIFSAIQDNHNNFWFATASGITKWMTSPKMSPLFMERKLKSINGNNLSKSYSLQPTVKIMKASYILEVPPVILLFIQKNL